VKREINLRPKEFVISREFYLPRLLLILGSLFLFLAVFGGAGFLYLYQLDMKSELSSLEGRERELEERLAPMKEMEQEIEMIQNRENFRDEFFEERVAWSSHLQEVYQVAGENNSSISRFNAPHPDEIVITGESESMQDVVELSYELDKLDFLTRVFYESFVSSDAGYDFTIEATLDAKGESD